MVSFAFGLGTYSRLADITVINEKEQQLLFAQKV